MSRAFEIRMARGPEQIDFTIFGESQAEGGEALAPRQPPAVPPDQIERLRQGLATLSDMLHLSSQTSAWLLGADLKAPLATACAKAEQDLLRVVFHVDERLRNDPALGDLLADLPVELLALPGDTPLVLSPLVAAFVHRLSKVQSAWTSPLARTPPLRVLMVRSNPQSLGGAVPGAAMLRDKILQWGQDTGPAMVEVDLLSREPGSPADGLPTRDGLFKALSTNSYDILVYLGHGGREDSHADLLPLAFLYLESADGAHQDKVRADVLANALHNHPIPVVLLVGCLTAAEVPPADWEGVRAGLPGAMRGNQGMAQALVNSSSGVQVALGMRSRLESEDAMDFLLSFFESLLQEKPGNVDAAVHKGRERLHAADRSAASFSAPVLYRTLAPEPLFGFLESPPAVLIDPLLQEVRASFWRILPGVSAGNAAGLGPLVEQTARMDELIVQQLVQKAAVLVPEFQLGRQEGAVSLPIKLAGSLTVTELEGVIVLDSPEARINRLRTSAEVRASDYRVLSDVEDNRALFRVERKHKGQGPIPQGPLLNVEIVLGPSPGTLYPVAVDVVRTSPKRAVGSVNNVIVVPAV